MTRADIEFDEPKRREDILGCRLSRIEVDTMTLVAQGTCLRFDKDGVVDSFIAQDVALTEEDVAAIVAVIAARALAQGKIPAGKLATVEPVVAPSEPTPL